MMSLGSNIMTRSKNISSEEQRLTSTGEIFYSTFLWKSGVDTAFYPTSLF
jgi:hypothetical protein